MSISSNFSWPDNQNNDVIYQEIFVNKIYEKFFQVKEGDVVVDIGANVGCFTASIIDSKPSVVHCVEPSTDLFAHLLHNIKNYSQVKAHNFALSDENKFYNVFHPNETKEETKTFKLFCEENKIYNINFLKIDCEGCEFSILTEDNKDFLLNNVDYIVAEIHLWGNSEWLNSIHTIKSYFYETNVILHDNKGVNVIERFLLDKNYIPWYCYQANSQFTLYIDNTNITRK